MIFASIASFLYLGVCHYLEVSDLYNLTYVISSNTTNTVVHIECRDGDDYNMTCEPNGQWSSDIQQLCWDITAGKDYLCIFIHTVKPLIVISKSLL